MTLISSFLGGGPSINIGLGIDGVSIASLTGEVTPEQVAAISTSIKFLSETMAKLPVAARDENGQIADIPENILFMKPNEYQTWYEFARTAEVKVNRWGNALAFIKRKNGVPINLELVQDTRIKGWELRRGMLIYIIEDDSGAERKYSAEDILHFKSFSLNGIWGLNPVEILKYNYEMIGKTQQAVSGHLSNGLLGISVLESDTAGMGAFGKEIQTALTKLNESKGYLSTEKIVPLPPGHKLHNVPINLKDADFLANIKANSQFIATLYGVPPHVVTGDAPKYATYEQSMIEYRQSTVSTKVAQYKAEMELKLFTDEAILGRQLEVVYDVSKLTATDARTQTLIDEALFKMGVKNGAQIARDRGLPSDYEGSQKRFIMTNNLSDINGPMAGSPEDTETKPEDGKEDANI